MLLRVRTTQGTKQLECHSGWTVNDLRTALLSLTGIKPDIQKILVGFPPKRLEFSHGETLVAEILSPGEVLTIERAAELQTPSGGNKEAGVSAAPQNASDEESIVSQGQFVRRRVPDDNSCLFRSVITLLAPNEAPDRLRKVIADAVREDPDTYNEAFLGKSNADYQEWIQEADRWGGAIELSILSAHYKVELAAIDVKTARVDCYGENSCYALRSFLIYDGIHYDPLVLNIAGGFEVTQFGAGDQMAWEGARSLALEAQAKSDFTDTNSFRLRCGTCGARLKGQAEALAHAKSTGHTNFREG